MFPSICVRTGIHLTGRHIIASFISLIIIWITLDLFIFNFIFYGTVSDVKAIRANDAIQHFDNAFIGNGSKHFHEKNIIEHVDWLKLNDLESNNKLLSSNEINSNLNPTNQVAEIKSGLTSKDANIENVKREHRLDLLHAKLKLTFKNKQDENMPSDLQLKNDANPLIEEADEGRLNLDINDDNEEVLFQMTSAESDKKHSRKEQTLKTIKNVVKEQNVNFTSLVIPSHVTSKSSEMEQASAQKPATHNALTHVVDLKLTKLFRDKSSSVLPKSVTKNLHVKETKQTTLRNVQIKIHKGEVAKITEEEKEIKEEEEEIKEEENIKESDHKLSANSLDTNMKITATIVTNANDSSAAWLIHDVSLQLSHMPLTNVSRQVEKKTKQSIILNSLVNIRNESDIKDSFEISSKLYNSQEQNVSHPVFIKDIDIRRNPFNLSDFGERGWPVIVDKSEEELVQKTWNLSLFNQYVSDKISLERSIPDSRNLFCKYKTYYYSLLPKTSIIICFTDEAWSTLIRSINSILNRTPMELLSEILLVDDFSQRDHLKQPLNDYIKDFPIIKLIRLKSRHGLIRARLTAIEQAVGPVITLLDSHVECNIGWLEPLLEAIRRNRRAVIAPIIDAVDQNTFKYEIAPDDIRGGFDWGLNFEWNKLPQHEIDRQSNPSVEILTATTCGGLLAMDKKFFYELGAYDPDLEVWGAENLEISFKTWMCGGSLEIHPCSRVGHVFRNHLPYTMISKRNSMEVFLRNSKRVAEVWMDDYKELFFKFYPEMRDVNVGDTASRKEMVRRGCNNFQWYLNKLYPGKVMPTLFPEAWGLVTNLASGKCLHTGNNTLVLIACEWNPNALYHQLSQNKQIEAFRGCIGLVDGVLLKVQCDEKEKILKFSHRHSWDQVIEMNTNKCLTPKNSTDQYGKLELLPCASNRLDQKWSFQKYATSPNHTTLSTRTPGTNLSPANLIDNMSIKHEDSLLPSSSIMHTIDQSESVLRQDSPKSDSSNTLANVQEKREIKDSINIISKINYAENQVDLQPIIVKNIDIRKNPYNLSDAGENGEAVVVDKSEISLVAKTWNLSQFNQYVSDKISFERSIPDVRSPLCKLKTYIYPLLPKTSIIICFTDEAWSTLIRTINSVLNRTPSELLSEIILVDDFSQRDHLKQPLDDYIKDFPIIKLIRLKSRHGLIRARLTAIEQAVGPVITLLDSHVECNIGWLEPLLDAVRKNRRAVIAPVIDIIDDESFRYIANGYILRGEFDWSLNFEWNNIPQHEKNRRSDPTVEIRTATICGGLFSMDKQFFYELGAYDPALEIWGAENIEISFKTWMCGGSLEIHPCSRVGHVFRHKFPYTMIGKNGDDPTDLFLRNSKRVAEVWMDDYKELFYKFNPKMRTVDVGDTSSRKETVRKGCKDFQWYLNELYPGKVMPTLFPEAWGFVSNLASGKCLKTGKTKTDVVVSACEWNQNVFYHQLSSSKQLQTFIGCIGLVDGVILRVDCNENNKVLQFSHEKSGDQIIEVNTNNCLTPEGGTENDKNVKLQLLPCASDRIDQKWSFENYRVLSSNRTGP